LTCSKDRFTTGVVNFDHTGPCTLTNLSTSLFATSDYLCMAGCGDIQVGSIGACNDPISKVLYLTDSYAGSCVLTYGTDPITTFGSFTGWYGDISYSYGGCGECPPRTVNIHYQVNDRAPCHFRMFYMCHTEIILSNCPGDSSPPSESPSSCFFEFGCSISSDPNCPPGYSMTLGCDGSTTSNPNLGTLYCLGAGDTVTWTISE
jgi:hypothetical protein